MRLPDLELGNRCILNRRQWLSIATSISVGGTCGGTLLSAVVTRYRFTSYNSVRPISHNRWPGDSTAHAHPAACVACARCEVVEFGSGRPCAGVPRRPRNARRWRRGVRRCRRLGERAAVFGGRGGPHALNKREAVPAAVGRSVAADTDADAAPSGRRQRRTENRPPRV